MYRVMLVDDDYPVLELLSEEIDWESIGLVLCGKFENGLLAWEYAQQEVPHIVVTDIGMPKMDGLELITKLRQLNPAIRVAIISCHNEFQYAQQAMRLSVQDYLLKDILEPEDVEKLLYKFKLSLDSERELAQEQIQMRHLVDETKELRKEMLLRGLVQQPLMNKPQLQQQLQQYGILEQQQYCIASIGYIERYSNMMKRYKSEQTFHFALCNVMEEITAELPITTIHVSYQQRQSILLFSYKPSLAVNIYDQIMQYTQIIQQKLKSVLKVSMAFIIGSPAQSIAELKSGLVQLTNTSEQRFYLHHGQLAKWNGQIVRKRGLFERYEQAVAELRDALIIRDEQKVIQATRYWENMISEHQYCSEEVRDWVMKLIIDLRLKLHHLLFKATRPTTEMLHKEMTQLDSLTELFEWFTHQLHSLIGEKTMEQPIRRRQEIQDVIQYVNAHLHRKISLEEVAQQVHMNASYFSRFFKREAGQTFIEFVTNQKMQRAKEMLDHSVKSVNEICELLGYDNQSYFIKTFKSYVGLTPMEYRGQVKSTIQ